MAIRYGAGTKQAESTGRKRVYDFLVKYTKGNGYAPTIRGISIGTGLGPTATAHNHLVTLALWEWLEQNLMHPGRPGYWNKRKKK